MEVGSKMGGRLPRGLSELHLCEQISSPFVARGPLASRLPAAPQAPFPPSVGPATPAPVAQ